MLLSYFVAILFVIYLTHFTFSNLSHPLNCVLLFFLVHSCAGGSRPLLAAGGLPVWCSASTRCSRAFASCTACPTPSNEHCTRKRPRLPQPPQRPKPPQHHQQQLKQEQQQEELVPCPLVTMVALLRPSSTRPRRRGRRGIKWLAPVLEECAQPPTGMLVLVEGPNAVPNCMCLIPFPPSCPFNPLLYLHPPPPHTDTRIFLSCSRCVTVVLPCYYSTGR